MARTSTNNKIMLWGAGGVTAVVLALTAYAAVSGGGHDSTESKRHGGSTVAPSRPVPTYSVPPDWTEPARWLALPRGKNTTADGYQTNFPDTADGAVAMLVAADSMNVEGSQSTVDAQLAVYNTYMASTDKSSANEEKVREAAAQTDGQERGSMGLPTSGPLPSGAFVRTNVVGFKVIQASPGEVTAYLLTRVAEKAGETATEKDSYTSAVVGAVWQGGDWKLSTTASNDALQQTQGQQGPAIAAPGDAAFNSAGWTAIRQAS